MAFLSVTSKFFFIFFFLIFLKKILNTLNIFLHLRLIENKGSSLVIHCSKAFEKRRKEHNTLPISVCYSSVESVVGFNKVFFLVLFISFVVHFVLVFVLVFALPFMSSLPSSYFYCYLSPKGQGRVKVGEWVGRG
jgi:hypothetical protein